MASSLFCINKCQFENCGLFFASLHDLIQHIEETHLPILENERRKRDEEKVSSAQQSSPAEGNAKSGTPPVGPAMPLSSVYRLFPALPAHKAQPIKYEPTKISFYHYRKKQVALPAVAALHYAQPSVADKGRTTSRSEHDEEMSNDSFRTNEDEGDSYEPNDDRRHKCPVDGCNKRYKNLQGARYHARTIHGLNDDNSPTVSLDPMSAASGGQSPMTAQQAPATKAAVVRPYKCPHCTKRYKTTSNLNKHVQDAHQPVNPNYSRPNMVPNLAPVSPATISNPIPSPQYQNGTAAESPLVNSPPQIPIGMPPNLSSAGQLPGVRVTAQPAQNSPPPPVSGGYQYIEPAAYSPITSTSSTVQVRSLPQGVPRTTANTGPVITYGNMVDGSQQMDSSLHVMQQRQPIRMPPAVPTSVPNRGQYNTGNPT